MNQLAPGAAAQEPHFASSWTTHGSDAQPTVTEAPLPSSLRLRASLRGAALGLLAISVSAALGFLLATAVFGGLA